MSKSSHSPVGVPLYAASAVSQGVPGTDVIRVLEAVPGSDNGCILAVYLMANGSSAGTLPLHFTLDTTPDGDITEPGNPMLDTMPRNLIFLPDGGGGGAWGRMAGLPTDSDNQPDGADPSILLGVLSRMQGYDPDNSEFNRVIVSGDGDGVDIGGAGYLQVQARGMLYNGSSGFDRARSASTTNLAQQDGRGAIMSAGPGEWAIEDRPAAATVATVTRVSSGVGYRQVCRSITVSLVAVGAQGIIDFVLRDGAAGVGPVLWSARFSLPAGTSDRLVVSGLNIVGSEATNMTLECTAAPAATNFAGVALTGYTAIEAA